MATINNTGKLAYMYDSDTDTWHAVAGTANTSISYNWTGTNTFAGTVTMEDVAVAKAGINNFQTPAIRDAVITSPTNGTVCFVRQDDAGNPLNQLQYFNNGSWRTARDNYSFSTKTADYTVTNADAGKTIIMNLTTANTITVPADPASGFTPGQSIKFVQYGVGKTTIASEYGVIVNSKNTFRSISNQYGIVELVNVAPNSWLLVGDLSQ